MEDKKNVAEKVISIIASILKVPASEISRQTAIGDLPEWDSLHHIQIISAVEKNFNFHFTPDVILDLEDVDDIISAVEARTSK